MTIAAIIVVSLFVGCFAGSRIGKGNMVSHKLQALK